MQVEESIRSAGSRGSLPKRCIAGEKAYCRIVWFRAIVQAVIGLGASLGITTLAEGVETKAQLAALRRSGCGEVQGFLFSRPVPAAEIRRLVAAAAMPWMAAA